MEWPLSVKGWSSLVVEWPSLVVEWSSLVMGWPCLVMELSSFGCGVTIFSNATTEPILVIVYCIICYLFLKF